VSKSRLVAAIVGAALVLSLAATFVVTSFFKPPTSPTAPTGSSAPATSGPTLDGTYTATFLPPATPGTPLDAAPAKFTWVARSVCVQNSCVATARFVHPPTTGPHLDAMTFDYVGGRWLSVQEQPGVCDQGSGVTVQGQDWFVISLEPGPDGTMSGTYRYAASVGGCNVEQPLTLTRTGNPLTDFQLPDPATLPPRVLSPAEGLHGRYSRTQTLPESDKTFPSTTFTGDTQCLRTGERCETFMKTDDASGLLVMVFADAQWTEPVSDSQVTCPAGSGTMSSEIGYPLPRPTQNPIAVLAGKLRQNFSGQCQGHRDYDMTLQRTGD
jgi:hypothetical protein